ENDPTPYIHYFVSETGGLLQPHELQSWRLLHAAPQPYTRERFDDTYDWTVKWGMTVPGATFENTVDNRAWEQLGLSGRTQAFEHGSSAAPTTSRGAPTPCRSYPAGRSGTSKKSAVDWSRAMQCVPASADVRS